MIFKRQTHIKTIITYKDKSVKIKYIKNTDYNQFLTENGFLHNPNHIFIDNKGFRTVFFNTVKGAENYNPLDFKSAYDREAFQVALNSKVIKDTFDTIEKPKIDITFILVIVNIVISALLLYMIYNMGGGLGV